ncbi:hypothetical protein BD780_002368 [Clostridium tetanomorphum]|uniref:ABC-2 family transporter protein n=1 Tax=Clostridium tetanomorphum TaxID=1553 RepID=A0A923EA55_CLOTT|nr:hypothetical protein [Clostridium tetanomorphum]KAJ51178.1 hypothetical protein CTM_14243 [Clostridium tetanomorphum DSM 665]MBC2396695.1 hypothetical protein [Clostridium tetanomorphum]MBP1866164.1 hypothetical protein [Clostridium tetanomorphum]NRS85143.1 hypothetical protein [Clostridium tetanomorphum]NRZ98324.1 hypothetical protein [Clostridium tetanomorphum]
MKLINKKRFNVQFNRYFVEGSLIIIFLFSILIGVIVSLWIPYDISKPYKGMNIREFLVFLCIMVPRHYDTEELKRDIRYFISLNYPRKEYFKNKIIMVNLIIGISVVLSTGIIFTIIDYSVFGYLGFIIGKDFISFLKASFVNVIIYNLFYTSIFMIQILFIKFIPNKIGKLLLASLWGIAFLIFWSDSIRDVYINITSPNIILLCSIVFIIIAYYIYYKFIMSLDV